MKIHIITAFDSIKAVRKEHYPFHDRTGNIENYFNRWVRSAVSSVPLQEADFIYLPIRFVDFFKVHVPGAAQPPRKALSFIYDKLETPHFKEHSDQYFTVCQWSHGTCMELRECKKFQSTAYKNGEIPIPLCVDPHPIRPATKILLASFVGNYATHPIRARMDRVLKSPQTICQNATKNMQSFLKLMASSWFALCPRGFGPASFRIFEALQLGAIPVIISDHYKRPYAGEVNWKEFSVAIKEDSLAKIESRLKAIDIPTRKRMIEAGYDFYQNYCTKEQVCKHILARLERCSKA